MEFNTPPPNTHTHLNFRSAFFCGDGGGYVVAAQPSRSVMCWEKFGDIFRDTDVLVVQNFLLKNILMSIPFGAEPRFGTIFRLTVPCH